MNTVARGFLTQLKNKNGGKNVIDEMLKNGFNFSG